MRAMTEIPAKTPRPIGSTESFFPGIAKPDSVALAAAAEPDGDTVVAEFRVGVGVGEGVPDEVGVGIGDAGTVETPCETD